MAAVLRAEAPIQAAIWLLRYQPVGGWQAVDGVQFTGTERGGGA